MRKAFLPLVAGLLVCGAATGALVIATSARAQNETHKPMMLAQNTQAQQSAAPALGRMRRFDPADIAAFHKQRCEDRYARAVGRMAYLETRLKLTAAQQSAFSAWRSVGLEAAKRRADACAQRDVSQRGQDISPVDRMGRMEDRLKQRIADLDAERPAFTALYNALSPDQRKALAPDRHMMRGGMGRHRGMDRGFMRPPRPMNEQAPAQR